MFCYTVLGSKILQKLLCSRTQRQLLTVHQHQLPAGQLFRQCQREQIAGMVGQAVIRHESNAQTNGCQVQQQIITGKLDFRHQIQLMLLEQGMQIFVVVLLRSSIRIG